MGYFAVLREAGPSWVDGKGAFEQPDVGDHAAFMNELADQGFVLFAGPLAGSEADRIRVLLMIDAASESEIHERIAKDPWAATERLRITSIESWNVIAGAHHLVGHNNAN